MAQALLELKHEAPSVPCHAPSRHDPPKFGEKIQCAKTDDADLLGSDIITFVQQVVGKLLHHARAVDPAMLHAIDDTALTASKGTKAT